MPSLSEPRDAAEALLCLRAAVAGLRRARMATAGMRNRALYVRAALDRVDRFLDAYLEFVRAEQDQQVEQWWADSWGGADEPVWPDQSEGVAS